FNAVDGQAVDLVCLVLLSKENDGAQLNALAGVARRLRIPDVLDDLRRAPNRVVLYNVMIGRAGRYQSECNNLHRRMPARCFENGRPFVRFFAAWRASVEEMKPAS